MTKIFKECIKKIFVITETFILKAILIKNFLPRFLMDSPI